MIWKRLLLLPVAFALLAQNAAQPVAPVGPTPEAAQTEPASAPAKPQPPKPKLVEQITPMAQRVATIAVLNKQNGITRDIKLRPGQAVRLGNVIVRLRACEATPNWDEPPLTGAFLQVDIVKAKGKASRIFSGWTYAETPSLNPVADPVYDVWVKSCAMNFPDIGPDTIVESRPRAAASGKTAEIPATESAASESSAPKSPAAVTASDNND